MWASGQFGQSIYIGKYRTLYSIRINPLGYKSDEHWFGRKVVMQVILKV